MKKTLLFLAGTLALAACGPAKADPAAERAAIDKASAAFLAGMKTNVPDSLLPTLTDDVVFSPPNEPNVTGKAGIKTWLTSIGQTMKTVSVTVSNRTVEVDGNLAVDAGDYVWTLAPVAGGANVEDHGKFVAVERKGADGVWRVSHDIWNSYAPAAAPPPAPAKAPAKAGKAPAKAPSKATRGATKR